MDNVLLIAFLVAYPVVIILALAGRRRWERQVAAGEAELLAAKKRLALLRQTIEEPQRRLRVIQGGKR